MKNVFMGLVSRPAIFADSLSEMNSSALTRDADAPVMSVYHAEIRIIRHDLVFLTAGKFPKTDVIFSSIQYITPRCIPERASMCDAPLSLNASFIVLLTSDLSPDSRAFARALQSLSPNGTASIASLNASEHETAASCSREAGRNVSRILMQLPNRSPAAPDIPASRNMAGMMTLTYLFSDKGDSGVSRRGRHFRYISAARSADAAAKIAAAAADRRSVVQRISPAAVPAMKNRAIPAMSLSTPISFPFLAKIVIIF